MAYKRYGLGGQIIPFWKREVEPLPLWQKGDPQIRLFLPTFWMKMIKPPQHTPTDHVHFITHPQMTRFDVKNYLEKVYKVPVAHVKTVVKLTENKPPGDTMREAVIKKDFHLYDPVRDKKKVSVKYSEEYKVAIVQLADGLTFEYPDMESKISKDESFEAFEEYQEKNDAKKVEDYRAGDVPFWFR